MRTVPVGFGTWVLACIVTLPARGQEPVAKSRIVAASLFKNGLAAIKREVVLPGPGTFRLEDLPEPVHGTWWVESSAVVETTVKMRDVEAPAGAGIQFQHDLAGRKVTVTFKDGKPEPVTGIVLNVARPKEEETFLEEHEVREALLRAATGDRYLVLKTARGRMFIDPAQIVVLELEGAEEPVHRKRRPVLLLSAPQAQKGDKISLTYLTHGLAWRQATGWTSATQRPSPLNWRPSSRTS